MRREETEAGGDGAYGYRGRQWTPFTERNVRRRVNVVEGRGFFSPPTERHDKGCHAAEEGGEADVPVQGRLSLLDRKTHDRARSLDRCRRDGRGGGGGGGGEAGRVIVDDRRHETYRLNI